MSQDSEQHDKPEQKTLHIPQHDPEEVRTWWVDGKDTKSTTARMKAAKRRRLWVAYLVVLFTTLGILSVLVTASIIFYFWMPDNVDWFTPKGVLVAQCEPLHQGTIRKMVFSPDGQYLLTGSEDKTAILWDAKTGKMVRILKGHEEAVTAVAMAQVGEKPAEGEDLSRFVVMTGSKDMYAILWDMGKETPEPMYRLGDQVSLEDLDAGSTSDPMEGKTLADIVAPIPTTGHTKTITCCALSPGGQYALSGGMDDKAVLWNVNTGSRYSTLDKHSDAVYAVAFNPNGRNYVTGTEDGKIRVWNMKDDALLFTLPGHDGTITSLSFSGDGRTLLSGSRDNTVILWDMASSNQLQKLFSEVEVTDAYLSANEQYALSNLFDKVAVLWKMLDGTRVCQFVSDTPIVAMALSPLTDKDGLPLYIALANTENQIIIYNVHTK
ncbi:MAG: WD40 repeat domain-containing protein [Planctomycetia bacterium]|nr:WD40 repeat domain-containing protein [Planctomycetia bacterium]